MMITTQVEVDAEQILQTVQTTDPSLIIDRAVDILFDDDSYVDRILDILAQEYSVSLVERAYQLIYANPELCIEPVCLLGLTKFIRAWMNYHVWNANFDFPVELCILFISTFTHILKDLVTLDKCLPDPELMSKLVDSIQSLCNTITQLQFNDLKQLLGE